MPDARHTVKETAISIIIAFAMAFVFRGFVIEAFLIPTGSMAPTLMGAHMRFRGGGTGYEWDVGPWHYADRGRTQPLAIQAPRAFIERGYTKDGSDVPIDAIDVTDPMSGWSIDSRTDGWNVPRRAGDRIFVFKYLYGLFGPSRFDVIVFKYPGGPQENYIKRLTGLPGEQIALVDGDVFVRPASAPAPEGVNSWQLDGWSIARKPVRSQLAMWQRVSDSRFTPIGTTRVFRSPWHGSTGGWAIDDRRSYRYDGADATALEWDADRQRMSRPPRPRGTDRSAETWGVDDFYPYNEGPNAPPGIEHGYPLFPVSDVAMSFGFEPDGPDASVAAVLKTRGHEFRAAIAGREVVLEMRPDGGEWRELERVTLKHDALPAGRVTNVAFWHVDQSLHVRLDDRQVVYAEYDWGPDERIAAALGEPYDEVMRLDESSAHTFLQDGGNYCRPELRWEFGGGPFTLHRVALDRDVHYQAVPYSWYEHRGEPARATHPVLNTLVLKHDEYFACGDNSPASSDGRLWGSPDPWVAELIDPATSVVNRRLLIGKAFFVYFPAAQRFLDRPMVPDFGRLRWIW